MNYKMLAHLTGIIILIEGALMSLSLLVSLIYKEDITPFVYSILIIALISVPLVLLKPKNKKIYAREGFVCVALSWIFMSLFGALPFYFSGAIPSYIDSVFEAASGFSTTGASVIPVVEIVPKGILFWRSFTNWIGGMGVLVFMLAILPSQGTAIHLMRAEVPGPTKGKLVPTLRSTAKILYIMYFVLTLVQVVLLLLCKLPLYDSLVTAFSTAGTGGFSVKNASIGGYNNPAAEWVCAVFMLLFGINFNMYFFLLIGRIKDVFKSEELRWYLLLVAVATAIITINISDIYPVFSDALRHGFFQVMTITSTSGFATANFDLWPQLSRTVMFMLFFVGACAGSTAGGMKVSRVVILIKNGFRQIRNMAHPRSVRLVRFEGETVGNDTIKSACAYFILYMFISAISVLVISIDNLSFETNISAVVSCINNVGPGFDAVGPMGNFSVFSPISTVVLTLDMIIGRLEIMPIMILLAPTTWRR